MSKKPNDEIEIVIQSTKVEDWTEKDKKDFAKLLVWIHLRAEELRRKEAKSKEQAASNE